MKAILVINMPKVCSECMYSLESSDGLHYCSLVQSFMPRGTDVNNEVSVCCPLKTMPQKKTPYGSDLFNDYVNGWNDCLEEIEEVAENEHGM